MASASASRAVLVRSSDAEQALAAATYARAAEQAERFLAKSKAPNTVRAYTADWKHFAEWCTDAARPSLPATPETVALYLSDLAATHKASTLRRRLTTIGKAHELDGYDNPTRHSLVQDVFDGIRRELGFLQHGKTPLLSDDIRALLDVQPGDLTGLRNRSLFLVGFSGAFRRSELIGIAIADIQWVPDGLIVLVRRSKTDQHGEGMKKAIPYGQQPETCPVRSLRAWLDALGETSGPVFRSITKTGRISERALSDRSVALIIKESALKAGLDPTLYAGHSLRSGFATQAAISGASERSIIRQGGWASEKMARRYIRDASLFRDNAADSLGL